MSYEILNTSNSGEDSTKICTKCGVAQPKVNFRKYAGRSVDGLRPLCRTCQRAYEKTWRSQNPEYRRKARQKRKHKDKVYAVKYRAENRGLVLVRQIGRRAKKAGIPFDLDSHIPEIEARIRDGCEMTGIPFELTPKSQKAVWNSPSVDRIDPEQGYTYDNIRIICWAMNAALGSWGEETLRNLMQIWLER